MTAFSIVDFCRRFPDNDACLRAIFEAKFGDHTACPYCGEIGKWGQVRGTKKYFHTCRKQISLLKDTAFYRSNLSLIAYFYAILLFVNSSSGVRSSFVRKQLGLIPKSSHRLCNRVRLHMAAYPRPARIGGPGKLVEVDEVLLRHIRSPGKQRHDAAIIMGMACEGKVMTGIIGDRTRRTLHENILERVRPGSIIVTDCWHAYRGLVMHGFNHIAVNHSVGFFNEGGFSTCQIDSYWATLRRAMRSYHQTAARNLWLFLAEVECRYNFRNERSSAFEKLVSHWPPINNHTVMQLEDRYDWRRR